MGNDFIYGGNVGALTLSGPVIPHHDLWHGLGQRALPDHHL
jgi:hypothetical protein